MAIQSSMTILAEDFESWWAGRRWDWTVVNNFKERASKLLEPNPVAASSGGEPSVVDIPSAASQSSSNLDNPPLLTFDHFDVRTSPKGGYGAFARTAILSGAQILAESPLIQGTPGDFWIAYNSLSPAEKAQFLSLHEFPKVDRSHEVAIYKTNRFVTVPGSCGIFLTASRFNHSCRPSCTYEYNKFEQKLILTTLEEIQAGQEMTISYGHSAPELLESYGFICDCGHCSPPTESEQLENKGARRSLVWGGVDYGAEWRCHGNW